MCPAIVVVGRNSFFAKCFVAACADLDVRHVAVADLDRPAIFDGAGVVVNFAFNPSLYREPYRAESDVDRQIAERIAARPLRYVLLSSRMVYGSAAKWNAAEDATTTGDGIYGLNRVIVERTVTEKLGSVRLAILRISNTVAYEVQLGRRKTFMSQLLVSLRDRNEIHFDMSPQSRRDFVTDDFLCHALRRLIEAGASGIFNVGCGFPVRAGEIAGWVIEGFGKGDLVIHSNEVRDEFYLDVNKLRNATGLAISSEALRFRCLEIGRRLAAG